MQNKNKQFGLAVLLLSAVLFTLPLKAQVTIGDLNAPQSFSVLELVATDVNGGLRLPQMETVDRDAITTNDFKTNPLAKGLMIFNTTTDAVNIWDGTEWVEFAGTTFRSARSPQIALPSIPSVKLNAGKQVNSLKLSIPYSGKTKEEDVVLFDGQILGGSGGLSVVVAGKQTLSSESGVIYVKLTGTPSAKSKIKIPVRIEGAAGSMEIIAVNSNKNI